MREGRHKWRIRVWYGDMSILCWGNTAARLATSASRDISGVFPEETHLIWAWGGGFLRRNRPSRPGKHLYKGIKDLPWGTAKESLLIISEWGNEMPDWGWTIFPLAFWSLRQLAFLRAKDLLPWWYVVKFTFISIAVVMCSYSLPWANMVYADCPGIIDNGGFFHSQISLILNNKQYGYFAYWRKISYKIFIWPRKYDFLLVDPIILLHRTRMTSSPLRIKHFKKNRLLIKTG